jgi:peptidoglycan/xylan/chitin deacetylase (PgdA/CDA1 family)
MMVSSETYKSLLEFLRTHHEVLALTAKPPSWHGNTSRPRVIVTFDDGWKDTSEIAQPLAAKYGIPITVFVCPGLAGKSSPFWPERVTGAWRAAALGREKSAHFAQICRSSLLRKSYMPVSSGHASLEELILLLKSLPARERNDIVQALSQCGNGDDVAGLSLPLEATMSWEDTTRLVLEGAEIGSHTQHHEILPMLPAEEVRCELAESKRAIENRLGSPCVLFAYPNGSWSAQVREQVVQHGYSQAFVNSPGVWTAETDPWLIPRVNLWEGALLGITGTFSPAVFQYTAFWRSYRAARKVL